MLRPNTHLLPPSEELDNPLLPVTQEESRPPAYDSRLAYPAQPRESDFRFYVNIILARKWLILTLMLVATTYVALRSARQPAFYGATTTVRSEPPSNDTLSENNNNWYVYRGPEYWNTQLRLLESPQLMRKVALRLDLPNNPAFLSKPESAGLLPTLRRLVGREPRPAPTAESAGLAVVNAPAVTTPESEKLSAEQMTRLAPYVKELLSGLNVHQLKDTNLIEINYTHRNPAVAVDVANAVALTFIEDEFQRETAGTQNAVNKLAREVADLQQGIRKMEEQRISEMKTKDLPLGQAKGQDLTTARLGTLSDQLLAAENERKKLQSAFEQAAAAKDMWSVPQVNESSDVQEGRKELRKLEQQRAALLAKYTEQWPGVVDLDSQIAEVKGKVERAAREALGTLQTRYETARDNEQKLRAAYEVERAAANRQSQAEIMMSSVNQEITTNKELYSTLIQRQKELEILSNRRASNISVLTPAALPEAPLPRNRARDILIALGLSLSLGILLAYTMHMIDMRLRTADDVAIYLQLPVLAQIPGPKRRRVRRRARAGQAGEEVALALTRDVRSPAAEAYRHLRTSLLLSTPGHAPKSILVTSAQPGEGKTTTAINIAITFAQEVTEAQERPEVLLIDCDLRRPRVHEHFNLANGRGLTTYLTGQSEVGPLLHEYDALPNLKILTAGPIPANPADLLSSYEMLSLFEAAGERFKYIVVDSPPASSFADAALLSTIVDGVVLVVHSKRSSRGITQRVKQRLLDIRAHIFGVVLNYCELESDDYYAGYYSNYYGSDEPMEAEPTNGARRPAAGA